jgi:uncharacterized protein
MYLDSTIILILPAFAFAMWAQWKVKSTYRKYAQIGTRAGLTGAEVARRVMRDGDIPFAGETSGAGRGVGLEAIGGQLTDHYDPRDRTLRLSQDVYNGQSIAALGIAAHEVGHAIQHHRGYAPMHLRSLIYPVTGIGSTLAFPLFFIGLIIPQFAYLMWAGILFFSAAVLFTIVTLPVEFNASSRALAALRDGNYLTPEEMKGARAVLSAAAMTYVAATAMAMTQLIRLILIARSR